MESEPVVVYGAPDIVDFMEGTRSLGEFCQKRLNAIGDAVVLVRIINVYVKLVKKEEPFLNYVQ